MLTSKVTKLGIGPDRTTSSTYDSNPYLNSIIYEVEFHYGKVKEYAANVIAEKILTQVDADGLSLTMLDNIINYQKDEYFSVPKIDMHDVARRGQKNLRKTTIWYSLLVKWIDSYEAWIPLKYLK